MLDRRTLLALLSSTFVAPKMALAAAPLEITWDDLIPSGVPYSEIIGEGERDENNDLWNPIYDANGIKLNENLDGAYIRMPGFVVPFDLNSQGVTDFMLVPYLGACIHTPPPPANQLVLVRAATPWPGDQPWEPVWVTGVMRTRLQSTKLGETGYSIAADEMEIYVW
ncbi:MAG: hypothetical protein COA47_18160 [Robiginitomaculum sp.]|nr:MAG: hypothetical protein COA47_18160 [Robiginitomaculum sp.]